MYAMLVTGGLVFMDDALIYHSVYNGNGARVRRFGRAFILGFNRTDYFFDGGA